MNDFLEYRQRVQRLRLLWLLGSVSFKNLKVVMYPLENAKQISFHHQLGDMSPCLIVDLVQPSSCHVFVKGLQKIMFFFDMDLHKSQFFEGLVILVIPLEGDPTNIH